MAYSFLSEPGTKYGPCEGGCNHKDCASTRKMAQTPCAHCGKPIGYDTNFSQVDEGLLHLACLYETVEI